MTEQSPMPEGLQIALTNLVDQIVHIAPMLAYQKARERFNTDIEAKSMMKQLSDVQNEIRQKQFDNQVSVEDLQALKELQAQVQQNEVIISYAQSQQDAITKLREVNAGISSLVGTDFAALAKNNSC
jgi:cell fate (sporulation/competence/biofilm development) regulator YlbF (YheA/YmcA/DUF963 family)